MIRNSNADFFIEESKENDEKRTRREANPTAQENRGNRNSHEIKYEPLDFPRSDNINNNHGASHRNNNNNNRRGGGNGGNSRTSGRYTGNRHNDNREPELDKLIKDIRQKVKDSKKFWSNLPHSMCNNDDVFDSSINHDNCWNGHSVDR